MPFYVSPEQITKDKADFARKGIARGKSIVVAQCDEGVVFVAENPSRALHKISEIYDRIAFGAVGKYNEFEQLRVAGIRLADTRGFAYDRSDVSGRSLANAYAQTLGAIFTDASKPYEVELVVAEVGSERAEDQIYRLAFDGSVSDESSFVAMGGAAEALTTSLREQWRDDMDFAVAIRMAVSALSEHGAEASRTLTSDLLEVAVLDRKRPRRRFRRIEANELDALLAG